METDSRKGEYRVPDDSPVRQCRSCQAPIVWAKTPQGKAIPLSMATVRVDGQGVSWALNHFSDCPHARQHRKPAAAPESGMTRATPVSFLCGRCKSVMCEDCISIAEELQQLEQIRKRAMMQMEQDLEKATAELAQCKRRAAMVEQVARAGLPDIICAWMDQNFDRLLQTPHGVPSIPGAAPETSQGQ